MTHRFGERAQKERELRERVDPDDAGDLRAYRFKEGISSGPTLVVIVVVAAVLGWLFSSGGHRVGTGIAFFAIFLAVGVGIVYRLAGSRAAEDFLLVYAEGHGLELRAERRLPAATPLLRKGDRCYAPRSLSGQIAPGVDGLLALFVVEESSSRGQGSAADRHLYTLGLTEVPACAAHLPELYCQRRLGPRSFDGLEDAFRQSRQRVTLESTAVDDRFEIFVRKGQDEVWLRRLFSPSFVAWLAEATPADLSLELAEGTLVVYVPGHREDAETLDQIAAATGTIAQRLLEESAQTS
jgi:hypothetical protein